MVSSSLVMICAQRLCRRICRHCRTPADIPEQVLRDLRLTVKPGTVFYEGKGCEACRQTGYLGRVGITEVLSVDDRIREMLILGESSAAIKEYAQTEQQMVTLRDDILKKFEQGETTLEEVWRITSGE